MAVVAILVIGVFTVRSYVLDAGRQPAEKVLRLQETPAWMIEMKKLEKREPESIYDYRKILLSENTDSRVEDRVLERVAAAGNPRTEVPFLISYLRQRERQEDVAATSINSALRTLTGLELPPGSTAQEWYEAWESVNNNRLE